MILRNILRSKSSPMQHSRSQLKKLMTSIDRDIKGCDKTVSSLVRFTFAEQKLLPMKQTTHRPPESSDYRKKYFKKRTNIICEITCEPSDQRKSYRSLLRNAVRARAANAKDQNAYHFQKPT